MLEVNRGFRLEVSFGFSEDVSRGFRLLVSRGFKLLVSRGLRLEVSLGFLLDGMRIKFLWALWSWADSVISVIQYRFRVIFSSDLRGRGCFQSFIASRFNAFPLSKIIFFA